MSTILKNIRSGETIIVQDLNIECYKFVCRDKSNEKVYALYSPAFTMIEDEEFFIGLDYEPSFQKYTCEDGYIYTESFQRKEVIDLNKNLSLFETYDVFEDWKKRRINKKWKSSLL